MTLEQRVNDEMKAAMKAGEKQKLETLRSMRAGIIEFAKSGLNREMNQEDEIKLLSNLAKKRKDAIEMYRQGGRVDLAEKEEAELEVIKLFLPEQLSEDKVREIIDKIKQDNGFAEAKDVGKLIGASMKELKGKAESTLVQQIAKELLG